MILHEFPAKVTDIIVSIFGRKPFAVRLCNKMQRGMRSLEYFTTHQVFHQIYFLYQLYQCCYSGPGRTPTQRHWRSAWRRRTEICSSSIWTAWIGTASSSTMCWEQENLSSSKTPPPFLLARGNWSFFTSVTELWSSYFFIFFTNW